MATRQITVSTGERVCVNCTHYRQCYRKKEVPGEKYTMLVPVSFGYCLMHDKQRRALQQVCKGFETQKPHQMVATPDRANK